MPVLFFYGFKVMIYEGGAKMACLDSRVHALMVAAGKGSRFGADVPKQYLTLQDQTVLQQSVARLNVNGIDDLTLVIAKDDRLAATLEFEFAKPIYHAIGGAERWQSVQSGVQAIRKRGACDDDWVVIHDAARPCLPRADLMAVLSALKDTRHDGVILATPVVDTLKQVDESAQIVKTVDRSGLWQAQTPQVFRLKSLESMLDEVQERELNITDEASGFEMLGKSVQVVVGSRLNMKLTYADDLPLLRLMVANLLD